MDFQSRTNFWCEAAKGKILDRKKKRKKEKALRLTLTELMDFLIKFSDPSLRVKRIING